MEILCTQQKREEYVIFASPLRQPELPLHRYIMFAYIRYSDIRLSDDEKIEKIVNKLQMQENSPGILRTLAYFQVFRMAVSKVQTWKIIQKVLFR